MARKTRAQLKAAENGHNEANKELALIGVQHFAQALIGRAKTMHQLIRNSKGIARAAQDQWMEQVIRLEKGAENFQAAVTAAGPGFQFGELVAKQMVDLKSALAFFDEAGISDETAKVAATAFGGLLGAAVVEAAMVARDVLYAGFSSRMTGQEARMARENLQAMEEARDQLNLRIGQLQGEMSTLCSPKTTQARPSESPRPIAPEGMKEEPKAGRLRADAQIRRRGREGHQSRGHRRHRRRRGLYLKKEYDKLQELNALSSTTSTTSTTTPSSGGSGSVTYRAQVSDICTPGANGDVTRRTNRNPLLSGRCRYLRPLSDHLQLHRGERRGDEPVLAEQRFGHLRYLHRPIPGGDVRQPVGLGAAPGNVDDGMHGGQDATGQPPGHHRDHESSVKRSCRCYSQDQPCVSCSSFWRSRNQSRLSPISRR